MFRHEADPSALPDAVDAGGEDPVLEGAMRAVELPRSAKFLLLVCTRWASSKRSVPHSNSPRA
jgi:hypothetical protein